MRGGNDKENEVDQVIRKLRQVEVLQSKGCTVAQGTSIC